MVMEVAVVAVVVEVTLTIGAVIGWGRMESTIMWDCAPVLRSLFPALSALLVAPSKRLGTGSEGVLSGMPPPDLIPETNTV